MTSQSRDFEISLNLQTFCVSLFQKVNSDYKIDLPSPYGDGFSSKRIVEILLSEI